jgi:geranylgeranyl diphosphate synthase type I
MISLKNRIKEFQKTFEPYLEKFFKNKLEETETEEESYVWQEIHDYVLAGGKRIRPFILWQMIQEQDSIPDNLYNILVGFELLHNSTLIDDDIIDQHTIRRHRPTLPNSLEKQEMVGEHMSVIASGLLLASGLEQILQANTEDKFKQKCIEAYADITKSVNEG